jgi:hypothetical protein
MSSGLTPCRFLARLLGFFGIAILVSLSITPVHNFSNHFRAPEVRRTVKRHTVVSQAEDCASAVTARHSEPIATVPPFENSAIMPTGNQESPSVLPVIRWLRRLKLGTSRSGPSEAFL